jgi:hypothetical protein
MDEITIPYHLAIPTVLCLIGLIAILINRKRLFTKNKLLWTSITIFLILYFLVVSKSTFDGIYYQWDLNRYDLDKDGMFGGEEITTEQSKAMQKLISDTGRNFSFITGFIFAFIISTIFFIFGKIIIGIKTIKKRKNHT